MFFALSKTFGYLVMPSNLLISIAVLGVLLLPTRFARAGRRLAVTGIVLLLVAGLSPLGNALMVPLESRFPRWDASRGAPDGILVLGGVINADITKARGDIALDEAAERLTAAAELARRYPAARIVFTGGAASLVADETPEADVVIEAFEKLGVPRERVTLESQSRNTVENAIFSKAMIRPKPGERWLMITSANHMPRAMGIFRAADFPVEAYPVDWRTRGYGDLLTPFTVLSDGLKRTDTAVREWIGLMVYRLTGRTSELFPGPN
jgi:uncharacterized SAM-binding protein YcdF (DUF218 family)